MSSRLKSFGFAKRSKNHQNSNSVGAVPQNRNSSLTDKVISPSTADASPSSPPSGYSSSTPSLHMNGQSSLGRPPSYTYNNSVGRSASPLPPGHPQQLQQTAAHPPAINTNVPYNASAIQPGISEPPGYGMQQQHSLQGIPLGLQPHYGPRGSAGVSEADSAGRNKAQLIVGIDFGTTFSGVAFAFATNNEAREDIITEWPGAGTHTKQKVCPFFFFFFFGQFHGLRGQTSNRTCLTWPDPNRFILRSIPESYWLGPGYCRRSGPHRLS